MKYRLQSYTEWKNTLKKNKDLLIGAAITLPLSPLLTIVSPLALVPALYYRFKAKNTSYYFEKEEYKEKAVNWLSIFAVTLLAPIWASIILLQGLTPVTTTSASKPTGASEDDTYLDSPRDDSAVATTEEKKAKDAVLEETSNRGLTHISKAKGPAGRRRPKHRPTFKKQST